MDNFFLDKNYPSPHMQLTNKKNQNSTIWSYGFLLFWSSGRIFGHLDFYLFDPLDLVYWTSSMVFCMDSYCPKMLKSHKIIQSPVPPVFHTVVTVSIGLKNVLRVGTSIP